MNPRRTSSPPSLASRSARSKSSAGSPRSRSSLETPVGEEGDNELGDFLPDEQAADPLAEVARELDAQTIRELLGSLTGRERRIVELRFGLTDDRPQTLGEVGERFGVTRERIRQVEKKTLAKLRSYRACQSLREELD